MENNFIKIDGEVYALDSIRKISEIREHNNSQLYFRITYKNVAEYTDVEFEYSDHCETEDDQKILLNKLKNEMDKLHNFMLTGDDSTKTKTYFQTIDLRK